MNQRYSDIETANNNLTEEITKLTKEFNASKEREQSWKVEVDNLRLKIASLEEENCDVHQQLLDSHNVNRLTQVSLMATQTSYDELRVELERVTKEMQSIILEKEELLSELHHLQESTNGAIAQLQSDNRRLTQDVNDKCREIQSALNDKATLADAKDKEKVSFLKIKKLKYLDNLYRSKSLKCACKANLMKFYKSIGGTWMLFKHSMLKRCRSSRKIWPLKLANFKTS